MIFEYPGELWGFPTHPPSWIYEYSMGAVRYIWVWGFCMIGGGFCGRGYRYIVIFMGRWPIRERAQYGIN